MTRNKSLQLDFEWVNSIKVDDAEIISKVATATFTDKLTISERSTPTTLIKAISCVDLSVLFGNETPEVIKTLCHKAAHPLEGIESKLSEIIEGTSVQVQCAAVCVYPLRIEDACKELLSLKVNESILVASVAAGFPTGQFPLHTRLGEIYYAVAVGASEVDVVIDRSLVLGQCWSQLYNELSQMRQACANLTLKVILSVTECGSWTAVYKAAVVAMLAGCDFIKTSTGKEATTMTLHEGFVMCLAIKDFSSRTGVKVGLKPAGGVRTVEQAVSWMMMVEEVLGKEWVDPKLFRIGTSVNSPMIDNVASFLVNC